LLLLFLSIMMRMLTFMTAPSASLFFWFALYQLQHERSSRDYALTAR
jgi:hypothetical protein